MGAAENTHSLSSPRVPPAGPPPRCCRVILPRASCVSRAAGEPGRAEPAEGPGPLRDGEREGGGGGEGGMGAPQPDRSEVRAHEALRGAGHSGNSEADEGDNEVEEGDNEARARRCARARPFVRATAMRCYVSAHIVSVPLLFDTLERNTVLRFRCIRAQPRPAAAAPGPARTRVRPGPALTRADPAAGRAGPVTGPAHYAVDRRTPAQADRPRRRLRMAAAARALNLFDRMAQTYTSQTVRPHTLLRPQTQLRPHRHPVKPTQSCKNAPTASRKPNFKNEMVLPACAPHAHARLPARGPVRGPS